jgi:hypothetical protein
MAKTRREDIIEVLKQNYTHTCVICKSYILQFFFLFCSYAACNPKNIVDPNLDHIYFCERNILCLISPSNKDDYESESEDIGR